VKIAQKRPDGQISKNLSSPAGKNISLRKNGFGGYWATQILPFADPGLHGACARRCQAAHHRRAALLLIDPMPFTLPGGVETSESRSLGRRE
jgi:hypothetical protein